MTSVHGMRGITQVVLEGKGPVTVRPSDHVATGGEGSIYRLSDIAVKLYLDPELQRQRGVPARVQQFAKILTHPGIVAPLGLALNLRGDPVGHYLRYLEDPPATHPLARIFTNEFWKTNGFTQDLSSQLVNRMRDVVSFTHDAGAIMIDPNELNWFAGSVASDPKPYVIDVDGWAIGALPPTVAVMPSIRDWHNKIGHPSDWFSWAVVTFQVYTGIHPYKGSLDGYARTDMEKRMKDCASVFRPGVRLNLAVRDFSCIPGHLRDWYEAVFEAKLRSAPPSPLAVPDKTPRAAQVMRTVTTSHSGWLKYEKLLDIPGDPVIKVFECGAAMLASGRVIDTTSKQTIHTLSESERDVVLVKTGGYWLFGYLRDGLAKFFSVNAGTGLRRDLTLYMQGIRVVSSAGRMFVISEESLAEVKLISFGNKPVLASNLRWGLLGKSTRWFNGVGVMDSMGARFVILPFGDGSVAQVAAPELRNIQVVSGQAGPRFASFVALDKQGQYQKLEFTFDKEYRTYKLWTGLSDSAELNAVMLPKGVLATIVKDGELTVFVPTSGVTTQVADRGISTDMLVSRIGDQVVYLQGVALWSLSMV